MTNPVKTALAQGLGKYMQNTLSIATVGMVVIFGVYLWKNMERDREERLLLEKRYASLIGTRVDGDQLTDRLTQLATSYKEQAELAKEVAVLWKDLATERGERIKLTQSAEVSIPATASTQEGHDYEFLTKDGTKGYHINELHINGPESPPIGYVLVKKDGQVSKRNYEFRIKLESVQIKDDLTGEIRVVTRAFLIPDENGLAGKRRDDLKKWKGHKYPLTVLGGEIKVDPHEPTVPTLITKDWIVLPLNVNPGLGVFGTATGTHSRFTFDTNLMGYGLSKRDLDWKLLQVGVNYTDDAKLGLHIIPGSYRPFPNTLTNTYIGPGWWTDSEDDGYFLGLNVGF